MKIRNFLLGIFSICTLTTYAQSEVKAINNSKSPANEFKLRADKIEELKDFDWNTVREVFKDNDENQEISLSYSVINKLKEVSSKDKASNFQYKLTGKTANLEKLITMMKGSVADRIKDNTRN